MSWDPTTPLPEAFKEVPRRVYDGDPNWIPEDEAALDVLFSDRHDYFERARAVVEVADGTARLAGFYHPGLHIDGRPAAFFGYWETLDELAPNRTLFARVEQWARRQGARRLYGPIDFSTFIGYRLRTTHFEAGCFPGEPYNPSYYPRLIERLGYRPAVGYVSQSTGAAYQTLRARVLAAKAPFLDALPDAALRIEPLTARCWMDELDRFYAFVEDAFRNNVAYTSISRAAFRAACGEGFARRLCPHTSLLVRDGAGEIAAFFLVFPDYAPLLRQGNPAPLSLQDVRFDRHFEQLERPVLLAKTLGVHPSYRRQGLMNTLAAEAVRRSAPYYDDIIVCTMQEDNHSVRFGLPFADEVRRYALYAKDL